MRGLVSTAVAQVLGGGSAAAGDEAAAGVLVEFRMPFGVNGSPFQLEAKMTPERRVNENPKGNDVSRLDAVRSQRGHTSVTRERVNQRGAEGPA